MLIIPQTRPKKQFRLNQFDSHERIGIDFDGTLVGHKHSWLIQRYIAENQHKQFYIITFRSHGMQDRIERDLRDSVKKTGIDLNIKHFTGIHNIADGLYENHLALKGDPDYISWKAVKCAEIGCTILIDDMAELIHEHFPERGIIIVSPDDFDL